jgi:benzoyl-CoA reductase/2-hydroxyglutaryl-CoA dehydratase subunit BcrC/BadD/HgdB
VSGSGIERLITAADRIEARIVEGEKARAALEEIKALNQQIADIIERAGL